MYGGERLPAHIPRSERAGSPYITTNIFGSVGNVGSGINDGTLNQSASELELSVLRIVRDSLVALSSGGVAGENIAASREIRSNTNVTDFEIISLDDYRESPPRYRGPTLYEIYVCTLLAEGHGLPCWHPRPSEPDVQPNGVVPGDVGTYSQERGFQRIFNLWGDDDIRRLREIAEMTCPGIVYRDLKGRAVTSPNELHKGEILVHGASVYKWPLRPPLVGSMYEFRRHRTRSGALLAATSSANKEETNDPIAMGEYIKQNAEAIYRHASSFRTIGEEESLYIITGSIKSDSWAMAAYGKYAEPEGSTLRLVPVPGVEDGRAAEYEWRSHGSASRARFGRSTKPRVKDQSLFLRGFKVAFSPRFRSRVNAHIAQNDISGAPGPDRSTTGSHGRSGAHDRDPRSNGKERKSGGGGGRSKTTSTTRQSGSRNRALPSGIQERQSQDSTNSSKCTTPLSPCSQISDDSGVCLVEDAPVDCTSLHPSDMINAHLLKLPGCEIAICHDDAWRFLLKSCHALIVEEAIEVADIPARIGDSGNRVIGIQNGVACLEPANFNNQWRETTPPTPEITPKIARLPRNLLTVVPDSSASSVAENSKRRSYESPQSTLTLKPPWNCSTPTIPCTTDTTSTLQQTDVVILVLGTTGSGRSTFINALVPGETPRMEIGDSGSLEACTTAVEHQVLDEAMLRVALGFTKNYRVVLVDTPGFNSSRKSDSSMLRDIESWSQKWIPRGGCRGGVVLLHDITTPSNEHLAKADVVTLSASFPMVIATSKWKYESQDKAHKIHDALASKWEKPSKQAKFYPFKEFKDAPVIIKNLLSKVENSNTRVDFSSVFKAMADVHKCREAEFTKRERGWKGIVRSLAFWKR